MVLGVAEHQPDRDLRAVSGDDQGDGDHLVGDVEPVDHQHRRLQPAQIAGQQLAQRCFGGRLEATRHRRLRGRLPDHTDGFGESSGGVAESALTADDENDDVWALVGGDRFEVVAAGTG